MRFGARCSGRYAASASVLLMLVIGFGQGGLAQTPDTPSAKTMRADGELSFLRADGAVAKIITIEIADTPKERANGMMGRPSPGDTVGMLFVYERAAPRAFWMRDTPASLDMIFVAGDGRVINMEEHTTPMSDQVYRSSAPAQYVVEVRAGFAKRYGIDEQTRIVWRRY